MYSGKDIDQHINGCDVLRHLIEAKEEALSKINRQKYESYYQRQLSEIGQMQRALDSLLYIVDYHLLGVLVQALDAVKDSEGVNGVIIYYPFKPTLKRTDCMSHINLCSYE